MGICACPSLPWSARRGGRASLAASTGTALIVTRNGAIERIDPAAQDGVAEASDPDGANP